VRCDGVEGFNSSAEGVGREHEAPGSDHPDGLEVLHVDGQWRNAAGSTHDHRSSGFAHVRLTVTDFARSRAFYDQLFWGVAYEVPADADEATQGGDGISFWRLGLGRSRGSARIRPVAPGEDVFSEDRVGLDHLSLSVGAKTDLDDAIVHPTRLMSRTGRSRPAAAPGVSSCATRRHRLGAVCAQVLTASGASRSGASPSRRRHVCPVLKPPFVAPAFARPREGRAWTIGGCHDQAAARTSAQHGWRIGQRRACGAGEATAEASKGSEARQDSCHRRSGREGTDDSAWSGLRASMPTAWPTASLVSLPA